MELITGEYSRNDGTGSKNSKYLLKCNEHQDKWFELKKILYETNNKDILIINALFDKNIDIVLKISYNEKIEKEFEIANSLLNLPNFIRYFCKFICNDSIINILNNRNNITNYKICKTGNQTIGFLVMKHYELGSVEKFNWTTNNTNILKNILKQVVFAYLYAYFTIGFIHGDLHCGNILLKPNRQDTITYGNNTLKIYTLEAMIMDFEKSKIGQKDKLTFVIKDIQKLFNTISDMSSNKLNINYDYNGLTKLKSEFLTNLNYYVELNRIIDGMIITFY